MKNTARNNIPFFNYLIIALVIITCIVLGLIKFINILPGEYFGVLSIFLLIIMSILIFLLLNKAIKIKVMGGIFSLIYIVGLVLGIVYELNTINFLKRLGYNNFQTENYKIIVINDDYNNINDLNNKVIGSLANSEKRAHNKLENKIIVKFLDFDNLNLLEEALREEKVDAILIEDNFWAVLIDEQKELVQNFRVIYEFSIEKEIKEVTKDIDITKNSFNIYIAGMDSNNSIKSVSRHDVNILLSVNPKEKKILITTFPKDYWIDFPTKKSKDTINEIGMYGIEESVLALENLLDIKINYYLKVNFNSMIEVIDTLNGIKIYSNYDFISKDGYHFVKGYNTLNGDEALSFVREIEAFDNQDEIRVNNQVKMLKALIRKVMEPSIVVNYNNLIKNLENSLMTNLDHENISNFIKTQINNKETWKIEAIIGEGVEDYQKCYSFPTKDKKVTIPNNIEVIKAKIKEAM